MKAAIFISMTKNRAIEASPRLMTLKGAAAYLGVSHWTMRKLIWRGDIPHVPVGRLIQLDRADLDAWIDSQKRQFGADFSASKRVSAVNTL